MLRWLQSGASDRRAPGPWAVADQRPASWPDYPTQAASGAARNWNNRSELPAKSRPLSRCMAGDIALPSFMLPPDGRSGQPYAAAARSEEHTSELQSRGLISY